MADEKNPAAVKLGRLSAKKRGHGSLVDAGRRGGTARAENLSPTERKQIARKGGLAKAAAKRKEASDA